LDFLSDFTILAGIVLAAFFDIKERRIPNIIVYPLMFLGLLFGIARSGADLASSALGLLLGILILLLPFAFGWTGAGDVKFLAATGALVGYELLPRVLFYSCIGAGIIALLAVILGKTTKINFRTFWRDCTLAFLTSGRSITREDINHLGSDAYSVPWGVAIGTGTIMAYYVDFSGKIAGF
jgi:prepilin peptidase CpaA